MNWQCCSITTIFTIAISTTIDRVQNTIQMKNRCRINAQCVFTKAMTIAGKKQFNFSCYRFLFPENVLNAMF